MDSRFGLVAAFAVCVLLGKSNADTPANCTYEEIKGKWVFSVGDGGKDKTVDCSTVGN